jgi:hypothetical protein
MYHTQRSVVSVHVFGRHELRNKGRFTHTGRTWMDTQGVVEKHEMWDSYQGISRYNLFFQFRTQNSTKLIKCDIAS